MLAIETKGDVRNHMTISSDDGRIHAGQALFDLFRSPRLLDAVETFIGSEIHFSPVGHTRVKPPERLLPEEVLKNAAVGSTFWHQDLGVTREWMNEGKMLKVWIPMTESTVENGCLIVVPGSQDGELARHCFTDTKTGIRTEALLPGAIPLSMEPGDVLFLDKMTMHCSGPNKSDAVRWSFDLRYVPMGQPTGRDWYPGFVARSRANPEFELKDAKFWGKAWKEAAERLAKYGSPISYRWDPEDPMCA